MFVNLTTHGITIQSPDGCEMSIWPTGLCRVVERNVRGVQYAEDIPAIDLPKYGYLDGLPDPRPDTNYIVSLMCLQWLAYNQSERTDVFAPATGPSHKAIRDGSGNLLAVTQLIRLN